MSEAEGNRRISLTLNPAIELEALVLQQLQALPPRRRQEWLRGLLLAGFVEQRRLLQELTAGSKPDVNGQPPAEKSPRPTGRSDYAAWLARKDRGATQAAVNRRAKRSPEPKRVATAGKPFARLSRVIGG